jgi:hypothetical protein
MSTQQNTFTFNIQLSEALSVVRHLVDVELHVAINRFCTMFVRRQLERLRMSLDTWAYTACSVA